MDSKVKSIGKDKGLINENYIKCTKCGQVHGIQGLLHGTHCSNCQTDLVKELF